MRLSPAKITVVLWLFLCFMPTVLAQQVRHREAAPFERPKALTSISSKSNEETLKALRQMIEGKGFVIKRIDRERGEFLAIKSDAPSSDSSDRILLWLERDPSKPTDRAYIYILFGRFEPFLGSKDGPVRVVMWPNELARLTALEDAIVAFADGQ